MNNANTEDTNNRAYMLQAIENQQFGVKGSHKTASLSAQIAGIKTIADLHSFVKQHDKDFNPPEASSAILCRVSPTFSLMLLFCFTVCRKSAADAPAFGKTFIKQKITPAQTRRGDGECYCSFLKSPCTKFRKNATAIISEPNSAIGKAYHA